MCVREEAEEDESESELELDAVSELSEDLFLEDRELFPVPFFSRAFSCRAFAAVCLPP